MNRRSPLAPGKPLARRTGLRPRSPRTERVYRERAPLVAGLLAARPFCEVPSCRRRSADVHEPLTRGRGGPILDETNCRAVCRPHHREIHDREPAWAYELGFLVHSWDARTPPT